MSNLTIGQAIDRGIKAYEEGNVPEADRLFTAVLKEIPSHPQVNYYMGKLAESVGQYEIALPFYEQAVQSDIRKK